VGVVYDRCADNITFNIVNNHLHKKIVAHSAKMVDFK